LIPSRVLVADGIEVRHVSLLGSGTTRQLQHGSMVADLSLTVPPHGTAGAISPFESPEASRYRSIRLPKT